MTVSNLQSPPFQKTPKSKKVSWEVFEKKYLSREDSWKYEWINGIVEKTKRTMYPYQYYILTNLRDLFDALKIEKKVSGYLESETDIFILKDIHRRPDVSFFTKEQVALMAHGQFPTPEFVIEVVSKNDVLPKQNLKMKNYRDAGIKVVWQIFPDTQEVVITRGKDSVTCIDNDVCSASPVLPDFKIAVKDIFKKPPKPVKKT